MPVDTVVTDMEMEVQPQHLPPPLQQQQLQLEPLMVTDEEQVQVLDQVPLQQQHQEVSTFCLLCIFMKFNRIFYNLTSNTLRVLQCVMLFKPES